MTEPSSTMAAIPLQSAMALLQAGRFAEAEAVFRQAAHRQPSNVSANAGLAMALKGVGKAGEARDVLLDACGAIPANTVLLGTLGTVFQDLGDHAAAAKAFTRALAIDPALVPALNNLALTMSRLGDAAGSRRQWQAALCVNPAFQEARLNLLSTLYLHAEYEAVRSQAAIVIRAQPANLSARLYLARAEARLGAWQRAERILRNSLLLVPSASAFWFELGELGNESSMPDNAVAMLFERCIHCAPGDARAFYNLGVVRGRQGSYAAAIIAYQCALDIDPALSEARSNLATAMVADRRYEAALPILEAIVEDDPDNTAARVALAGVLRRQGELDRAEALLVEVLKRHAMHSGAMVELSYIHVARDQSEKALALVIDACASAPSRPELQKRLADLYRRTGAYDLAVLHYDNCLTIAPGTTEAFCHKYHAIREYALAGGAVSENAPWFRDLTATVFSEILDCPAGYESLAAFNSGAADYGGRHPSLTWQPGDKTTRKGAQTNPTLLAGQMEGIPAILRRLVLDQVEIYLDRLDGEGMPFLRAIRPDEVRINMWCVFLEPGGHQLTHNHPAGWISGVYYLRIPASVTEDAGTAGCIEFGRPHADDYPLADRHPTLTVKPEPGMMVLFPSSLYHRTFPFPDGQRVCLAFDVVDRRVEYHD